MKKVSKNYEECLQLLKKFNIEEFHIQHGETVGHAMGFFAQKLGYEDEKDYWSAIGLLHDIDFEMWPEEHCQKCIEILQEAGFDNEFIDSIRSHGFGMVSDIEPKHEMEKVLYAVDELTGIIGAYALMRPSKNTQGMELKSLKKKFKDKKFAAGCNRDVIKNGADMLGWDLDKLLSDTILAVQDFEASRGIF